MNTKEITRTRSILPTRWLDIPEPFDWIEEFIPRSMKFRNSDWRSVKIEEFMKDGKLVVKAEMPGIDPDKDIEVSVHDGYLTIQGERHEEMKDDHRCEFSYGSFYRSILLPRGTDEESVKASYKDGILEVTLNVTDHQIENKKVPVKKG